jgi:hypothetical protein
MHNAIPTAAAGPRSPVLRPGAAGRMHCHPRPSGPGRPDQRHMPARSGCNNPTDGRRSPVAGFAVSPALITGFTLTTRLPRGQS